MRILKAAKYKFRAGNYHQLTMLAVKLFYSLVILCEELNYSCYKTQSFK